MNGKLTVKRYAYITWEVPDFLKLPTLDDYFIESPQYHLAGVSHCLRLYTSICRLKSGWRQMIGFELLSFPSYAYTDASHKIGYKSITGKEVELKREVLFLKNSDIKFLFTESRYIFERENDTYVPNGTLSVFCRIRLDKLESARRLQSEAEETSKVNHTLYIHKDGVHKLQSDYKDLLLKGLESDAWLVVRGKEFKVHRSILRARSPVFNAMFGRETAEKESGRVVIDDLDPDSLSEFLEYVYTGRVEAFSNDNIFGVYVAADKYQLHTLKSMCVEYMIKNISVDSFCDVMTLALQHNETNLVEQAVDFFKKNLAHIISTVKWQQFMVENSMRVNELLLKAFVPGEQ